MTKVSEEYPRLYHYTDWAGLQGIWKSQALWATNANYLNDLSELQLVRHLLKQRILPTYHTILEEACRSEKQKAFIDSQGGITRYSESVVENAIRQACDGLGDQYITSFCGTSDDDYITQNGLLSQWRGYGAGGGFAIVFQTEGLEKLLSAEHQKYDYFPSSFADAMYGEGDAKFDVEFLPAIKAVEVYLEGMLRNVLFEEAEPHGSKAMSAMQICMCRYKHRGFSEEREVRIAVAPCQHSEKYLSHVREGSATLKPEKEIKYRRGRGTVIPYVELFGEQMGRLPIDRIIVGAGATKLKTAESLRTMLRGTGIAVVVSEIPFV